MARLFLSAALAATLVLSGCSLSPRLDRQFGASVQQALAQQTRSEERRVGKECPV